MDHLNIVLPACRSSRILPLLASNSNSWDVFRDFQSLVESRYSIRVNSRPCWLSSNEKLRLESIKRQNLPEFHQVFRTQRPASQWPLPLRWWEGGSPITTHSAQNTVTGWSFYLRYCSSPHPSCNDPRSFKQALHRIERPNHITEHFRYSPKVHPGAQRTNADRNAWCRRFAAECVQCRRLACRESPWYQVQTCDRDFCRSGEAIAGDRRTAALVDCMIARLRLQDYYYVMSVSPMLGATCCYWRPHSRLGRTALNSPNRILLQSIIICDNNIP